MTSKHDATSRASTLTSTSVAPQRPLVLAIDVGTSSTRATVYGADGRPALGVAVREKMFVAPQANADAVVESVDRAVDELLRQAAGMGPGFRREDGPGMDPGFRREDGPGMDPGFRREDGPGVGPGFRREDGPGVGPGFRREDGPGMGPGFRREDGPGMGPGFRREDGSWRIAAVGLDTLASSVVGVDSQGKPCTPLSTYADWASVEVAADMRRELDVEDVRRRTGCTIHPSYLPARIAYFQRTGMARGVERWVDLGTLLLERWLGRRVPMTYSVASWTGLLDRRTNRWDAGLLGYLGLTEGALPRLCDETELQTGLAEKYARRWPALRNVPFCPAIGDGAAANVGSACIGANRVALTVGTSGAMRMLFPHAPDLEAPRGLWAYRLGASDTLLGASFGEGGNVGDWARSVLQVPAGDEIKEQAAKRPPASHGLSVLPFIRGERSTGWSLDAKAALVGFRADTTAVDIYQAMVEATTYRYAKGWRLLQPFAASDVRIIASGGGLARSPYWAQLIADVFALPVTMFAGGEASSRGSAIVALRAIGAWKGLADVLPEEGVTYRPRMEYHAAHAEAMERQERLYDKLVDGQL